MYFGPFLNRFVKHTLLSAPHSDSHVIRHTQACLFLSSVFSVRAISPRCFADMGLVREKKKNVRISYAFCSSCLNSQNSCVCVHVWASVCAHVWRREDSLGKLSSLILGKESLTGRLGWLAGWPDSELQGALLLRSQGWCYKYIHYHIWLLHNCGFWGCT